MHRAFLSMSIVAALCACGSATDAITFQAPAGYVSKASLGPFMQIWAGPRHNSLMLMAFPAAVDVNKMSNDNVKNGKILKQSSVTICGSQPAHYVSMLGEPIEIDTPAPGQNVERQLIDFIATDVNGKTYMAMYVRPAGTAGDPAAEAAIKNICPKS